METMYGAQVINHQTEFRVWAPLARQVLLRLENGPALPMQREEDGEDKDDGSFRLLAPARAGDRYFYQVDENQIVPDPVSRFLPEGVHGPTEIVDPTAFRWTDASWKGMALRDYILYELHVGTFTPEGTFAGVIRRLEYLKRLGITVLELMPVAAFPGRRNWGYDGASPYAVQSSYGGPDELKRLVDAAHARGLAVVLDVVYNHLGNEGNYLHLFGPYFTSRHRTPWGNAVNFDDAGSAGVRRYFVQNALYWIREYHMDGLRLDAIQTIRDDSAYHIVEEIRDRVKELAAGLGREVCVIAETDTNDARLVRPKQSGGFALDAIWSDDFHHAMHTLLTRETTSYYQDFGRVEQVVRALNEGFAFQGEHFQYWDAPRGTSSSGAPLPAHVIALQNHDQIGNRARGERLGHLVSAGARRMAAALLLLAPQTPLLFMGEEYGETAPFQFFTSYGDPALRQAVREGRPREFPHFRREEVPDPEDPQTFARSRLHLELAGADGPDLAWYRQLIALRKQYVTGGPRTCRACFHDGVLELAVPRDEPHLRVVAAFPVSKAPEKLGETPPMGWRLALANAGRDGYAVNILLRTRAC